MIYDVYRFLVENEETFIVDLVHTKYLNYIDIELIVISYIENVIREHFSSANAEQLLLIMKDDNINKFVDQLIITMEQELYGSKNSLH